jgi:hypothetical protein
MLFCILRLKNLHDPVVFVYRYHIQEFVENKTYLFLYVNRLFSLSAQLD